ncbi:flagellin N-terminal helical domain-containing protein [Marinobacter shengliensis]|uniref:flagellin N-terminal helical domain-containing protein n=1 Tax=Marinobacter shengliensis TaxID=1389223 RepID=UPI0011099B94|nr:flagellin [Marinobacter shengliensis]|eukprot:TRINITY_DN2682_c4_g1_i1.p2 TRINITY_DN2682_c4_g1~~TRINITY_DN2682_c4_g1_i1.p2  ORF type:complete len:275 (-),score=45.80 TRINITY_DN2682_c4_g1_i1:3044-3868(-)
MALGINTNISSLSAQNQLSKSQNLGNQALERLSSGLRINSAKDDAAGLAIATKFDAQIRGLTVAQRNANDGISLAQTAEGALDEVTNNLQRIRELAVQAANATNSAEDRAALEAEVQARKDEIDRIGAVTQFNGTNLLDGTFTGQTFQVGANNTANDRITIDIGTEISMSGLSITEAVSTVTGAQSLLDEIDTALDTVNGLRGDLGAVQNRFESTIANLGNSIQNQSASQSRILDADFAAETAKLAKANVLQQAGISVLAQANARPNQVLSLLQ